MIKEYIQNKNKQIKNMAHAGVLIVFLVNLYLRYLENQKMKASVMAININFCFSLLISLGIGLVIYKYLYIKESNFEVNDKIGYKNGYHFNELVNRFCYIVKFDKETGMVLLKKEDGKMFECSISYLARYYIKI